MSEEQLPSLTIEDLLNINKDTLIRTFSIQTNSGEIKRQVRFRRLTYREIHLLGEIDPNDQREYTSKVVFMGSVEPKFAKQEEVLSLPHGFMINYSKIILEESGRNPFLVKT